MPMIRLEDSSPALLSASSTWLRLKYSSAIACRDMAISITETPKRWLATQTKLQLLRPAVLMLVYLIDDNNF